MFTAVVPRHAGGSAVGAVRAMRSAVLRWVVTLSGWLVALLVGVHARLERARREALQSQLQALQSQRALLPRSAPAAPAVRLEALPRPIRTFKYKGELVNLLQEERLTVGVEVGVFTGGFSRWMLDHWPACVSYYMVDLWAPQEHYRQMDAAPLDENLRRMDIARRNVEPHKHKATLVRNSSVGAAMGFADASVDFVYLDARHTYDAVTEDLEAWWPKVRAGGILAGEDYMESDEVWMVTATCNFGPRRAMYPWSGCSKWDLPMGSYFACKPRKECENATLGSQEAEAIKPACGSDYSLQADGTRRKDAKAVKSAVDEFAMRHRRQVQLAHRDNQRAFMWNTWAIRR